MTYLVAISCYVYFVGINATLDPRSTLIGGTFISCNMGGVLGSFSRRFGCFGAVFKFGFVQECVISSGNPVDLPTINNPPPIFAFLAKALTLLIFGAKEHFFSTSVS